MTSKINNRKAGGMKRAQNVFFTTLTALLLTAICEIAIYLSAAYVAIDEYLYSISSEIPEELIRLTSDVWPLLAIVIAFAVISVIGLTFTAGYKDEDGEYVTIGKDKIFTDIVIVVMIAAAALGAFASAPLQSLMMSEKIFPVAESVNGATPEYVEFVRQWCFGPSIEPKWVPAVLCMSATFIGALISVICYRILVVKIKARVFFKHTIIGKLAASVYAGAKQSPKVLPKLMVILIGGSIISATWIGTIPVIVFICIVLPKYVKKYEDVRKGVSKLKEGNLEFKIPVSGDGELDRFADDINEISGSVSKAVENELKSQRMKTDLITNVSHDLRTPLTSMVSYVDLLKTEGLDSENAPEYLAIIDEKTKRLQKLTEDLFAAAKASSGAIKLNIETIDMGFIANQALAEMEDKLKSVNLDIIYNQKTENTAVRADGQQLWRVIENLLVNVSKYALVGSRVYIDITDSGDFVKFEIKNISREQLNIDPDELMERFTRADASRNTEGSGLGLAIAKDLTALMKGEFSIDIDGDLFKATVKMPKTDRLDYM